MQDSKTTSFDTQNSTREMIWEALEGQRFLSVVIDGQLRMQPLADGTLVATPDQSLQEALHAIHKRNGRAAVIEALLQIKANWPSEFDDAIKSD